MDAYHRLQLVGLTSLFSPTVVLLAAGGLQEALNQIMRAIQEEHNAAAGFSLFAGIRAGVCARA